MNVRRVCFAGTLAVLVLLQSVSDVRCQQAGFELPVQLVGFPVIILAVRLSNFVKKLAYSLNPATYRSRNRRALPEPQTTELDVLEAEKRVVGALGAGACIYSRTCVQHAERKASARHQPMDWFDLLSQYKRSPDKNKQFYLLSVFLGDIVGSPTFCRQLAKRRPCLPNPDQMR